MVRILFGMDHLAAGGVERQTIELITRMDRTRFSPIVLCLYGRKVGINYHFLPVLEANKVPVKILNVGHSRTDKVKAIVQIVHNIWTLRPEIVHTVSTQIGLLTRLASPFFPRNTSLICAVRGNYSEKHMRLLEYTAWACSAIVTNGPHLKQQLVERTMIQPDRLLYIPNGIDLKRFTTNPSPHFRNSIVSSGVKLFVYVGRISPEKQLNLVIEAIHRLKQSGHLYKHMMRLVIVGSAPLPEVQASIEHLIAEYELEDIVVQHAETETPELYFHAADVSILYSSGEGMPNSVLESLAAGCPVIISEAANAAQIIEAGVTGWTVRNKDLEQLASVILSVLKLPDTTLKGMRNYCLNRAAAFSIESMVSAYESLYEQVLDKDHLLV